MPSDDATATCHACGHQWKLTWVVAHSLFRRLAAGEYECGPVDCPNCTPRMAALWSAARGSAAGMPHGAAPVNIPTDTPRARPAR